MSNVEALVSKLRSWLGEVKTLLDDKTSDGIKKEINGFRLGCATAYDKRKEMKRRWNNYGRKTHTVPFYRDLIC